MTERVLNGKKFCAAMITVAVFIVSVPLLSDSLIFGHDVIFHIQRIEGLKDGLLSGQFPVKLYGHFFKDYGYPVGYFYPDLFLYIPAIFRLLGFSMLFSYHVFLFIITVGTAFIAWYAFTKLFEYLLEGSNETAHVYGAVAAICYTGSLYRLIDLYVRSAVGESVAMCFFPLALISLFLLLKGKKASWIGLTIGVTGVLESHILSALMLFFAMLFMCLFFYKRVLDKDVLKQLFKAVLFIILLNLWFYAPFIGMYEIYDFHIKFDLKAASLIYVFSWDKLFDYKFFIGILPFIAIALVCFSLKKLKEHRRIFSAFLSCGILLMGILFLISPLMDWQKVSIIPIIGEKLGVLQFSMRLMVFGSLLISVILAIIFVKIRLIFISFVFVLESMFYLTMSDVTYENFMLALRYEDKIALVNALPNLKDTEVEHIPMSSLHMATNYSFFPYIDYFYGDTPISNFQKFNDDTKLNFWESVINEDLSLLDPNEIKPSYAVVDFSRISTKLALKTKTEAETAIMLPLWYFPKCYGATIDNKSAEVFEMAEHRLGIKVPEGEHEIKIFAKQRTPYRNACIISLIGLALFVFAIKRETV